MKKGIKLDENKPRPSLLPTNALMKVTEVLEFGAKKYAPDNWRHVSNAEQRYTDAALRHIYAHLSGEVNDAESGLSHLSHAATCLLFLLHFEKESEKK